jgi:hypothetical protein
MGRLLPHRGVRDSHTTWTTFWGADHVYNYRIFDRYNRAVASLAVLADDDPDWRPTEFRSRLFGCDTGIGFPSVKLLDFAAHEVVLEANTGKQ